MSCVHISIDSPFAFHIAQRTRCFFHFLLGDEEEDSCRAEQIIAAI